MGARKASIVPGTTKMATTREHQYQRHVELRQRQGLSPLGLGANQLWQDDPRHLLFLLSRYKFVAKMFSGFGRVLELGCGDAFASRVVLQEVDALTAVDFDPIYIRDARTRMDKEWPFEILAHDILEGPVRGPFDGAYSLDVIEHISKRNEERFVGNIARSLSPTGALIIGTPSIQSQAYASALSKIGHVNCKNHEELKALLGRFFHSVFIFSMNDEVVHTGFYPMAHYLFALCCHKKVP